MPFLSRRSRKLLIAISILSAIFLLVCGQTFLKSSLDGVQYIIYWSGCLFFTVLSLYLSLVELRFINLESRNEFKTLLGETIDEICRNHDEKKKHSKKD
ncbi:MAG: hypothetical protein N2487_01535 [Verrucomicrobiae bacterium]|nr:hypothetical protein [Verrucomicrobiae bacterium]